MGNSGLLQEFFMSAPVAEITKRTLPFIGSGIGSCLFGFLGVEITGAVEGGMAVVKGVVELLINVISEFLFYRAQPRNR